MEITGRKSATISVCMMVRNEEHNLKRLLPSLQGIYDELIVVDTALDTDVKDGTVDLVKSYGAKVYHHPWEDDFGKHRNQTIDYATMDWVFIVDADEELVFNNSSSELVRKWLANEVDPNCVSSAIKLSDIQNGIEAMQFPSVRLFRKGHVKYDRIIHNRPRTLNGDSQAVFCPLMFLKHYGYDLTPKKALEKRKRTETLLLRCIEQDPNDVVSYFYLVQAYTAYEEYQKAAVYVEKYEEAIKRTGVEFNGSIYCTAASVYRVIGDQSNTKKWILAGLKKYPKDIDVLLKLTEFGVWTKNLELVTKGAMGFVRAFDEYQKNPIAGGNRFTYSNRPEALAYCMFHLSLGLLQQSSETLDKLGAILNRIGGEFGSGMRQDVCTVLDRFGWVRNGWNGRDQITSQPKKVVNLKRMRRR